eukprot:13630_1
MSQSLMSALWLQSSKKHLGATRQHKLNNNHHVSNIVFQNASKPVPFNSLKWRQTHPTCALARSPQHNILENVQLVCIILIITNIYIQSQHLYMYSMIIFNSPLPVLYVLNVLF